MLFFSKEEFVEEPLKNILDCFQECHCKLLRHRNIYLHHVKQVIKGGGPWENQVLQRILKETEMSQSEVDDYLSTELPIFLELRVRYLQACERMQEAMALSKSCLENQETGKHLYFHQAYLTCLYKASLYENLQKEMAEIDGRDAVEIICNTESVEKDELLLSLCKAFLTRQLHKGDMYYIWDLVFIWSRLHLRAHPSRQGFLAGCLELASSATNVRAIFPFIKLLSELGGEGVEVAVELCARALQLCDTQGDTVTRSLVCKTIAFLLPHDLEICRACSLLVFCQERSLEAYRTVCLLYRHPDQEQHPHNNPLRTNVRFHILQMLKERLCFDPEFWNLLTLRTHCLELMSDNVMKDAVLNEMKEEEEKENSEHLLPNNCVNESCTLCLDSCLSTQGTIESKDLPENPVVVESEPKCLAQGPFPYLRRRKWNQLSSDDELDFVNDPEFKYHLKPTSLSRKPMYSLRRNQIKVDNSAPVRLPSNHQREYLSRSIKNQIFKRRGRKKKWLQGLPMMEQVQTVTEKNIRVGGKKRGRKPLPKLELSFPDNVIHLTEESCGVQVEAEGKDQGIPDLGVEPQTLGKQTEDEIKHLNELIKENGENTSVVSAYSLSEQSQEESQKYWESKLCDGLPSEPQAAVLAVEADPELDGPLFELLDNPVELLHNYSLLARNADGDEPKPPESEEVNGNVKQEREPEVETEDQNIEIKPIKTWRERLLRTQQYGHLSYTCKICQKTFKGLNVMRHAFSHLKKRKLRCILCGKRFKHLPLAKKHILEHINEMSNHKPSEEQMQESPPANGIMENEHQPEEEKRISVTEDESSEQKPKSKNKLSSLKREERIIRNIRILLRKTALLNKRNKNPNSEITKQIEFMDEQVVIKDGLVIIKNVSITKTEREEEAKETPVEENGCSVDITYPLCPSDVCDRVFLKLNSSLTRHAIKCHLGEEKVLEKTYIWSKNKCCFCIRHIQFVEQYKQHMKLHDDPLPFFCYHQECKQRFATQPELKDHINTHQPFRPQCAYPDCEKLFSNFQGLSDHEWRHYIPVPQKKELDLGASMKTETSEEAPWKQRVKIEEIWLHNKKTQSPRSPPSDKIQSEDGDTSLDNSQNLSKYDHCPTAAVSHELVKDEATINGFEDVTKVISEVSKPTSRTSKTPKKKPQKRLINWDVINVKDYKDVSTLAEGIQKNIAEPHITEHTTFRPEDPTYAQFVKSPFVRPPPSTYLDESVLSMRKRRSADQPPIKKYSYKKKKELEEEKAEENKVVVPDQKVRHRCSKCLSSFSTVEELQSHEARNTCSSLFGFDSDDES
ncbi:zinc finger protein 654 isoform X2 [Girardinichthys multiradiatus]|nr:zinc finger protein 654 isoform X2 [Girardinichthys multiradiatus]